MKNKKVIIGLTAALIVMTAVFGIVWKVALPKTEKGSKAITVSICSADKTENKFSISTDEKYLGTVLHEKKLVTDEEFKTGFYTVINGIKADYDKDKAWWCVTKDGKMTEVGMNDQPISDGDKFEITYTVG